MHRWCILGKEPNTVMIPGFRVDTVSATTMYLRRLTLIRWQTWRLPAKDFGHPPKSLVHAKRFNTPWNIVGADYSSRVLDWRTVKNSAKQSSMRFTIRYRRRSIESWWTSLTSYSGLRHATFQTLPKYKLILRRVRCWVIVMFWLSFQRMLEK